MKSLGRRSAVLLILFCLPVCAQEEQKRPVKYQEPPKAIIDLVDVRPTPYVEVSPGDGPRGQWLLIEAISGLPPISDLAQPELRLAGLRFNPRTNGPSRGRYVTALSLKALPDGIEKPVTGLPAHAKIRFAGWAPDAHHVFFVNVNDAPADAGLSLWIVDVESAQARRVPDVVLNGIFGEPCEWLGNSQGLICKAVPKGRGPAPVRSEVPTGPIIQENIGQVTPGPTFEDLLKSPEDEVIFDYYAMSQVVIVGLDGKIKTVGKPGVIEGASAAPDGRYALLDERHHPYSYTLPFERFPERISVVDLRSGNIKQLTDKPLEDTVPNVHDAVPTGPREFEWRSDTPSTIFWVEAADGGNPNVEAPVRDRLSMWDAPF